MQPQSILMQFSHKNASVDKKSYRKKQEGWIDQIASLSVLPKRTLDVM